MVDFINPMHDPDRYRFCTDPRLRGELARISGTYFHPGRKSMRSPMSDLLESAFNSLPTEKTVRRTYRLAIAGVILQCVLGLGLLAGAVYVAWHFISKWW